MLSWSCTGLQICFGKSVHCNCKHPIIGLNCNGPRVELRARAYTEHAPGPGFSHCTETNKSNVREEILWELQSSGPETVAIWLWRACKTGACYASEFLASHPSQPGLQVCTTLFLNSCEKAHGLSKLPRVAGQSGFLARILFGTRWTGHSASVGMIVGWGRGGMVWRNSRDPFTCTRRETGGASSVGRQKSFSMWFFNCRICLGTH